MRHPTQPLLFNSNRTGHSANVTPPQLQQSATNSAVQRFLNSAVNLTQQATSSNNNPRRASGPPSIHPQFRCKAVCQLSCKHCGQHVCNRGMKAILLGDTRVELFSTDTPPGSVQLVEKDYMTRNCRCRIRDVACLGCGNVIGYHVTQPCDRCLEACNNGHFWMFISDGVAASDRVDPSSNKNLIWANLPTADHDIVGKDNYELLCR